MITVQISVDSADPHRLWRFWAAVLDIPIAWPDVDVLLAAGMATPDEIIMIDGHRAWSRGVALVDPAGQHPRFLFTRVPEAKAGKNRLHLDLYVGLDERSALVERVVALGARTMYEASMGAHSWMTMADPEGNEFCISEPAKRR